jgi:hypothetical protein
VLAYWVHIFADSSTFSCKRINGIQSAAVEFRSSFGAQLFDKNQCVHLKQKLTF